MANKSSNIRIVRSKDSEDLVWDFDSLSHSLRSVKPSFFNAHSRRSRALTSSRSALIIARRPGTVRNFNMMVANSTGTSTFSPASTAETMR